MVSRTTIVCFSLFAIASAGCSGNVEKAKRDYLARGSQYVKEKNYDAAVIEYRNAIQKDPRFAEAYRQLAAAYLMRGDGANGLRTAVTAADLAPDNADAQIEAGNLLLLAGKFADAHARAEKALAKNPQSPQARVLQGNAAAGLKDIDTAIKEFEEAIRLDPSQPTSYTSLGALRATKGNRAEAEQAFQQAVTRDPKSVIARLALAQFYWSGNRLEDAERTMKDALAFAPRDERANAALAVFYRYTGRSPKAEQYMRVAADVNQSPRLIISLADYYIAEKRIPDAVPLLERVSADPQFGVTARMRLATVARMQGHLEEAMRTIEQALTINPKSSIALSLKSDFLRQDHKLDEALTAADAAVAADRSSAQAQLVRGRALAAKGSPTKAEEAFNEVLRLNPRAAVAQIELSRLSLSSGALESSVTLAAQAAAADPGNLLARLTLARGFGAKGDYAKAQAVLELALREAPQAAAVHAQMGSVLAQKHDNAGARAAFDRALELDPFQLEAVGGLTTLDFAVERRKEAVARLDGLVERAPKNPGLLLIAASAHGAVNDLGRAETLLLQTIEIDPGAMPAYSLLGKIYLKQNRMDSARAQFEKLANSQERPVGPLTIVGMIDQAQNRTAEAKQVFERVLKLDAQAGVAANNLAWISAEGGGNLDLALQLAQTAKTAMPSQAEVHDTLGWIYYKKDQPALAIEALRRSVELNPRSAVAIYHLGLAYEKSGDRKQARQMLEQYLRLDPGSARTADVKHRLESLGT